MAPTAQIRISRVILRVVATLNLHRQPEHLQKQHSYQDDQVAITAEDRIP